MSKNETKRQLIQRITMVCGIPVEVYSYDGLYWDSSIESLDDTVDRVDRIIRGVASLDEGDGWR